MPTKKKATDTVEKANVLALDEETRIVSTPTTKAPKSKTATKEATTVAKAASTTKATQAKANESKKAQAVTPKPKKEKQPKPITVTRLELAQEVMKAVSQHMEITGVEADAIVSEIIHSMIDSLKEGNKIEIRGFGAFRLRSRRARHGRNPKTGASVDVPSKRIVYFKLGKDLKALLLH